MGEKRDRWVATATFFIFLSILILVVAVNMFRMPPASSTPQVDSPQENVIENTQTVEARIVRVLSSNPSASTQQLELEILSGPLRGERGNVELGPTGYVSDGAPYHEGDHVLVDMATTAEGAPTYMVTSYIRTGALGLLSALFIGMTILVSGWKGVRSLVGLALSFIVLLGFVVPHILAGQDPVLVSVIGAFALLAVLLYLSLGWSLKTHSALLGVLLTLILIGLLSAFAVDVTRLSGSGSEDALTVQAADASINLRGLFLAGVIIGTLGVLADVVVTQVSAVVELAEANPMWGWREVYRRAMNIGHDHIAATINTLVLAYVGAAMPLLLLFHLYPEAWSVTINRAFVAEEIVRTLVGSLGLVAAVPITTVTASLLRQWQPLRAAASPTTEPESLH